MLDFFWNGTAYDLVAFTVIAVIVWIAWAKGFNRE